jgi:hypothetical protein
MESRSECLPAIAIEPPSAKEHGQARIEALQQGRLPDMIPGRASLSKFPARHRRHARPSALLGWFDIRTRLFDASLRKFGFYF